MRPLTARVIVNRVWDWHFGRPLVATPSDFGVQGEKPSDPQLLDDLAARFIAHGWSLKWLNREIMLSAAYRQSSKPRADGDTDRPAEYAGVAHEPAAAGCGILSRFPAAVGRASGRYDVWTVGRCGSGHQRAAYRLRPREPRAAEQSAEDL